MIYECINAIARLLIPSNFAFFKESLTSSSLTFLIILPFESNLSSTSTTLSYNNSGSLIFKSNNEILEYLKGRYGDRVRVRHAPERRGDVRHTQADISKIKNQNEIFTFFCWWCCSFVVEHPKLQREAYFLSGCCAFGATLTDVW